MKIFINVFHGNKKDAYLMVFFVDYTKKNTYIPRDM